MPRTLVPIRDFGGLNRRDGADRVLDNEFFTLQNWYPATKGLLYKTPGTTSDLLASSITGCAKITGFHRHYAQDGTIATLHHCEPDQTVRAKATTDLTLTVLTAAQLNTLGFPNGNLFGPNTYTQTIKIAYTFVGEGLESQHNTVWRTGYISTVGTNAWAQTGHQSVSQASFGGILTSGIQIQVPAFPPGVTAVNLFASRGDSSDTGYTPGSTTCTQMTYIGTVTQSGGTFTFIRYIAPFSGSTLATTITPNVTVVPGGSLKAGTYYVSVASIIDSNLAEQPCNNTSNALAMSAAFARLSVAAVINVNRDGSALSVSLPAWSPTGTKAVYVFIGTKNPTDHPSVWVGNIGISETLTINAIPDGSNAQTFNGGYLFPISTDTPFFSHCIGLIPVVEQVRSAFLIRKTSTGQINEVLPSRSLRAYFGINYDPTSVWSTTPAQANLLYGYIRSNDDSTYGNISNGNNQVTGIPEIGQLQIGDAVTGPGIPTGTTIQSFPNVTTAQLSQNATLTANNSQLHFTNASGQNGIYNKTIYPVEFAYLSGLSYFVNGVDIPWQTDGKTLGIIVPNAGTSSTGGILPPFARFITRWQDQLLLAGADAKNQVYACNSNSPRAWCVGGNTQQLRFVTIGDLFGDNPTAISVFSRTTDAIDTPGSYFLSFKKHGVWMLNTFPDPTQAVGVYVGASMNQLSGRVGCVAPKSIVSTPLGVLFLGNDGDIYMIRGGGEPYRIGQKVQPFFAHLVGNDTLMSQVSACYFADPGSGAGFYKISYPSSSTSTGNDAQLWADLRTQDNNPITWSGPHTGINVASQTVYVGESDNGNRMALLADGSQVVRLDDPSTFSHLGTAISSVLQSKTFRFKSETQFKRFMGALVDAFYDSSQTHSLLVEFFADSYYAQVNLTLSTGGAVWDVSQWDQGMWSDALYQGIPALIGDMNLVGRTLYIRITHSNPNPFILAAIVLPIKPERRSIV